MKVASSSSIPTDTINEALQTITHDVEDELVQNTVSDQQAKAMKVISNIDSVLKARQSSLITENEYKDAMKIIKEDLALLQSTDDTENGSFEKVLDEVYDARKEDSDKNKHIETVLKDVESLMKVASSSSIPTDTINEALQTITHDVEDELVQNTVSDQQAKAMKVISNIDSVLKARQSS